MTRRRTLALAATLVTCTACGDHAASGPAGELAESAESEPGVEQSHELAEAIPSGATIEQVLELKAKKYAAGFTADGAAILGTLVEGGRSDHLTVLRAGHCYRIVGAGADGVEDLDLFLFDPEGVQIQQDPGEDRYPALGMQSEICPLHGGAYRLQVHVYKGAGAFGAQVYRTP